MNDQKKDTFGIVTVLPDSRLFEGVATLADDNTKNLGFFPRQALEDSAAAGKIIACRNETTGSPLGYILYYVARNRAVIQHLCVAENHRRKGVARRLVNELKRRTAHLHGILLHCARELSAHAIYPHLDFVAIGEKPGRGKKPRPLTCYWFDHGQGNLFDLQFSQNDASPPLIAVIDANIFIKLREESQGRRRDVSFLQADWFAEEVSLIVTEELYNELDRCKDDEKRKSSKAAARGFPQASFDRPIEEETLAALTQIFGKEGSRSRASDLKQIAKSVAGAADFFLTLDGGIIDHRDAVHRLFAIRIKSPAEIITHIDAVIDEASYAPAKLAGASKVLRRLGAEHIEGARRTFLSHGSGETKQDFQKRLSHSLATPKTVWPFQVEDADHSAIALCVLQEHDGDTCLIQFLRARRGPLSRTLLRHLVWWSICQAVRTGHSIIVVQDKHVSADAREAFFDLGFSNDGGTLKKISIQACLNVEETLRVLEALGKRKRDHEGIISRLADRLRSAQLTSASEALVADVETQLAPLCLQHPRITNYVVPIQPCWALELFDERLANEGLFSAKDSIALQVENAYYRSGYHQIVTAPGHVLWYVSKGNVGWPGPMGIRAWSRVRQRFHGSASDAFKRFERLGVFQWSDVLRVANDDPAGKISAFRFSGTQCLAEEVPWKQLRLAWKTFCGGSEPPPFSMPARVSPDFFREIYELGCPAQQTACTSLGDSPRVRGGDSRRHEDDRVEAPQA